MESLSEVVFVHVCLSVTGLRIVYVSCSMCPLFFTLALVMEDSSEDRRRRQARERMQRYRRWLSAQQRDERRQYESDRRRLACQHQRNSLRKEQHDTVVCTTLRHNLSRQPATFHVLCVRHVLHMRIPSYDTCSPTISVLNEE